MPVSESADDVQRRTFAVFEPQGKDALGLTCRRLLSEQKETWAICRQGYGSLGLAEERAIDCETFAVIVQHNPGRTASTEARVGEKDIAARPCFLCSDKLPGEQKVIRYRKDYLILCNPMPVFPEHFTIAHVAHRPQAIGTNIVTILGLIDDFGPGWAVLYNGPRCGASAPDHLHFQVVTSGRMPIEAEVLEDDRWESVAVAGEVTVLRARGLYRHVVLMRGPCGSDLGPTFAAYLEALSRVSSPTYEKGWEPMINVAGFLKDGSAYLAIFPRRVHRPAAFFLEGDQRVAVSPAVAEMAGVVVTPVKRDYLRMTVNTIKGIYGEVSIDDRTAERAIEVFLAQHLNT